MADRYLLHYGATKNNIYFNHFTSLHEKDILQKLPSLDDKNFVRQAKGITEKKVILSVGQFVHRKGYDVLLKAAAKLTQDIGVYIIGGQITLEYEQLVKELNLRNVHFIDFMSPDKLKYYYLAADVFVLPTREDVWGLVINEAMACGLPIVTTDHCVAGIEMITNGVNGYVVPIENPEMLRSAIEQILSDENLRNNMASANLRMIIDYTYEVSSKDVISAIVNVYQFSYKK